MELVLERTVELLILVGFNAFALNWCFIFMSQPEDLSALWGLLSLSALGVIDLVAVRAIRRRWREQ